MEDHDPTENSTEDSIQDSNLHVFRFFSPCSADFPSCSFKITILQPSFPFSIFSFRFFACFFAKTIKQKIQIQPKCQQKTQSRTRICMFSWFSRCSADFPSFSFKIRCCSQVSVVFFFGTLHNSRTTLQLQRQLQLQLEQLHYTPN